MASIRVHPASGDVLLDARDDGRAMRLSWHPDRDLAVLSIWRGATCVATFQLEREDVPALVDSLVRGIAGTTPGRMTGTHQAS